MGELTELPIIGPEHRQPAVFLKHFEPFAGAGLSLTGIAVGLSRFNLGESSACKPLSGPVLASGAGVRAEYGPSRIRRSWANRHNNCYISYMSDEKHFHGWLRSGRVFIMSPKVFTDRIACHRWAKRQRAEVDGRLVLACSKCPTSRPSRRRPVRWGHVAKALGVELPALRAAIETERRRE